MPGIFVVIGESVSIMTYPQSRLLEVDEIEEANSVGGRFGEADCRTFDLERQDREGFATGRLDVGDDNS